MIMLNNISGAAGNILGDATTTTNTMVSNTELEQAAIKCLQDCRLNQCMIDASCDHLHKLRAPTLSKNGNNITPTSGTAFSCNIR